MSSEPTVSSEQSLRHGIISELRVQRGISLPLTAMNLTWFVKISITTAFLGRLGALQLAGGILGLSFANVTGFSVLSGLCAAMEPLCGQALGAKNLKLLHKTLFMGVILLLTASAVVSLLWFYVDVILVCFGQQKDIAAAAKTYLLYLLPDLAVTSFLNPLKTYLSSQNITLPVMFSSAIGLALHVPVNLLLVRAKGYEGVAMAVWVSDLIITVLLGFYVIVVEKMREEKVGGWWDQGVSDWARFVKLAGPCCLTTCLEWWCFEVLVLLTGRLPDAKRAVGVLAIINNFDYLLYSVMLSLGTCASIRVSNELGANHAKTALRAARVSLSMSFLLGFVGAAVMVAARGPWGRLFTRDAGIIRGVDKTMIFMAIIEVVNFPLVACGGIVRGTARPWLAFYANLGGFYAVALPLAIVAFRVGFGLGGMLVAFFIGMSTCLLLLLVLVARIDWDEEAKKALKRASDEHAEIMHPSNSQP